MPPLARNFLGLLGAIAGGAIGYGIFFWLVHQGFYGLVIPGAAVGLGASLLGRERSILWGSLYAVIALLLGFYTEWRFAPFVADESLGYFVAHIPSLKPLTLLMVLLGAAISFWLGYRPDRAKTA